jgi:hypothetical protein
LNFVAHEGLPRGVILMTAMCGQSAKSFRRIATLGPAGTDSESVAQQLADEVVLVDSFEQALIRAIEDGTPTLVSCGYLGKPERAEAWVDLNFRYDGKLRLLTVHAFQTRAMCIAVRDDVMTPRSIVIHPSTREFLSECDPGMQVAYVTSKPDAVRLTSAGVYDAVHWLGRSRCVNG